MADRDEYNEKRVNEPFDIFVNADLLINQAEQLKRMNEGKRGKPYAYSDALMLIILAVKEYFGLPYRQTEMLGEIWGARIPRSAGGRRG
ncbi:MAG: transposase [Conexivisphaerales archaeon]